MDKKKVIAELAAKKGVALNENDPLFSVLLLNEKILDEHFKVIDERIESHMTAITVLEENSKKKTQEYLEQSQVKILKDQNRSIQQFKDEINALKEEFTLPELSKSAKTNFYYGIIIAFLFGTFLGALIFSILT